MSDEPVAVTADVLAQAAEGRLVGGDGGRVIGGISIDSRTVAPGDLFFAIRGERFDGHAFVGAAFERGATGVVVSDGAAARGAGDAVVVLVDDTTRALQALARHVRRASGARVVAITGSAGKTTTKEIAAEFLSARYRVFRNKGNLNNHIGLPLSLLELRARPEVAVVELGMNHVGEIRTLVGIAEPDVRVRARFSSSRTCSAASARMRAGFWEGGGASRVLKSRAKKSTGPRRKRWSRLGRRVYTPGWSRRGPVSVLACRSTKACRCGRGHCRSRLGEAEGEQLVGDGAQAGAQERHASKRHAPAAQVVIVVVAGDP